MQLDTIEAWRTRAHQPVARLPGIPDLQVGRSGSFRKVGPSPWMIDGEGSDTIVVRERDVAQRRDDHKAETARE